MGNIASRAPGGTSSNLIMSGDEELVEAGHHTAEHRQSMRPATTEAPAFMRSVSNAQITVGPVTVAGRDSISSTIIQYFPSTPQDPCSGAQVAEILDWLSPINFRAVLLDSLKKRVAGTGLSFLGSATFQQCLEGKIEVLLGTGMPGAGKTILASAAIEVLQDKANASPWGEIHVGFAFLRYSETLSVRDILAALVRQALERHCRLQPLVAPIYERHRLEQTQPTQEELVFLLVSISKQFRTIVFAIDGLDEVHRSVRSGILKALPLCNAKLFLTSRPLERIESLFPNVVQITVAATKEDIERLIDERLDGTPASEAMMKTPSLRQEVISKVESKSKGMFLYAALQVAALQQCLTISDIRSAIANSPSQIDGMYGSTIKRIEAQHASHVTLSMQILSWLIYSRRSLRVEELQHALAMASNGYKFDPEKVISEDIIASVCCGLVTVEAAGRLVRLIHYTAKDALQLLCRKHVSQPQSMITSICIARLNDCNLLKSKVQTTSELQALLRQHPLLDYAYHNWVFHAHQCDTFRPTAKLLKAFIQRCQSYPDEWYGVVQHLNPIQFAARHDFLHLFPLKHTHAAMYNSSSEELGRTPLMIASWAGHRRGVRKLLKLPEIQVNAADIDGRTAIALAAFEARVDVVEELLGSHKVDVNACDVFGESPLMAAAKRGHSTVVEVLLERHNADVNLASKDGRTALIYAAKEGREDVVRELLQWHDVDTDAADEDGRTALLWAVYQGHQRIAALLLAEPDCQINTAERNGRTPLMWACIFGFATIVQDLLKVPGLDVNRMDEDGQTALMLASRHKHSGLSPALTLSSQQGYANIASQLLQSPNIEVNAVDKEERTALMWACYKGCAEVVESLLRHSEIQVNLADRYTLTALMLASAQGRGRVVELLLGFPGVATTLCDRDGRSAIDMASKNGHVTIVQRLLLVPQVSQSMTPTRQATLTRAAVIEREVNGRLASIRIDDEPYVHH